MKENSSNAPPPTSDPAALHQQRLRQQPPSHHHPVDVFSIKRRLPPPPPALQRGPRQRASNTFMDSEFGANTAGRRGRRRSEGPDPQQGHEVALDRSQDHLEKKHFQLLHTEINPGNEAEFNFSSDVTARCCVHRRPPSVSSILIQTESEPCCASVFKPPRR